MTMKISALKKKYKNKWILGQVIKEDELHKILEVKPLIVTDSREEVYKSLTKLKKGAHVATLYTGPVPAKGMVFSFYGRVQVSSGI